MTTIDCPWCDGPATLDARFPGLLDNVLGQQG